MLPLNAAVAHRPIEPTLATICFMALFISHLRRWDRQSAACLAFVFPADFRLRKLDARFSLIVWRVRAMARASAGTLSVITDPVATLAPAPTLTGATRDEFEPMKAPLPMSVWCLATPS